jgi:hypothetical protein
MGYNKSSGFMEMIRVLLGFFLTQYCMNTSKEISLVMFEFFHADHLPFLCSAATCSCSLGMVKVI